MLSALPFLKIKVNKTDCVLEDKYKIKESLKQTDKN